MRQDRAYPRHARRRAFEQVSARPAMLSAEDAAALQLFALELATNPLLTVCLAIAQRPAESAITAAADQDIARDYATLSIAAVRYVQSLEALIATFKGSAAFMEAAIEARPDAEALRAEAMENFRVETLKALGVPMIEPQGATT